MRLVPTRAAESPAPAVGRLLPAALVAGWLAAAPAFAAPLPGFDHFGREDGLPHNTVSALLEDRHGFVWVATDDGVARFDGYEFEIHRPRPESGRSQRIAALAEDRGGTLWAGGSDGLFRVDRAMRRLVEVPLRHPDGRDAFSVSEIALAGDGALWVAARDGLFRRPPGEDRFAALPIEGREGACDGAPGCFDALPFHGLAIGPDGAVWACAGSGPGPIELFRWSGERFERVLAGRVETRHIGLAIDRRGRIWINGLAERPPGLPLASYPGALADAAVTTGVEGRDAFYLGGDRGLVRVDHESGAVESVPYQASPTWHQRWIRTLLVDRAGGLWIGTLAGLYRRVPAPTPFRHRSIRAGADGGSVTDPVGGLAFDRDGALWIGTMGSGLHRLDPGSGEPVRVAPPGGWPCGEDVWSILEDRAGRLWVATNTGVCRRDPGARGFERVPIGGGGEPIGAYTMVEAPADVLWLATTAATVVRLDVASGAVRRLDYPLSRGFGTWLDLGEDGLWLGTAHGSVLRIDPATGAVEPRPLEPGTGGDRREFLIYDLADAGDGRLWLATEAGLFRHAVADGASELVLGSEALPNSVVFSLLPGRDGALWLATNLGLARFEPARDEAPRLRFYGLDDGVGNLEFNRYSRVAAPDGELLFGGMTGLTRFRPEAIAADPYAPPTALSEVRLLEPGGERRLVPERLDELVLRRDVFAVTFRLAALGFRKAGGYRYAYRLVGADPEWIDGGESRSVRYSRLPPGRYVFRARSVNRDGLGGGAEVTLPVRVLPAFWQTGWFVALATTALLAALFLAHRLRVRRLLEIQAMRLRIASDLHDELGTELASIAFSASMVERAPTLDERERRRLEGVREGALRVMGGLRDVVWFVNPEHDRASSLAEKMRSYADSTLGGVERSYDVRLDGDESLDMATRRQLLLIFRELAANVARHARATRVEIGLTATAKELRLTVADDGVGFDGEDAASSAGTGLGSVRRRAEGLGGAFELSRRPGGGTLAEVRIPRELTRTGHRRASAGALEWRWTPRGEDDG